jgi:hypothetical protein
MMNERCGLGLAYIPLTKALLMLFWSRYLMKYPVYRNQYPSIMDLEFWLLTQTRKSQHSRIQLEQEMSFFRRLIQRIPDITLPFPFRFGVNDLNGLLLHLHFLILEFSHPRSNQLNQTELAKSESHILKPRRLTNKYIYHPSLRIACDTGPHPPFQSNLSVSRLPAHNLIAKPQAIRRRTHAYF